MVGRKMMMNLGMKSIFCLAILQGTMTYAGSFYTIIGPDGRPLVVQRNEPTRSMQEKLASVKQKEIVPITTTIPASILSEKKQVLNTQPVQPTAGSTPVQVVEHPPAVISSPVQVVDHQPVITVVTPVADAKMVLPYSSAVVTSQESVVKPLSTPSKQPETASGFNQLDGEQYVSNEYLEDKEFNLEGRKRFYTMPEGIIDSKTGSTRLQTIEREKGVGQSVIQSLFKKKPVQDDGPITLASTYYRVSQNDSIEGLGKQCFSDQKLKKAKTLINGKDVNLWPRAPLANDFDYELIKVQSSVQNIKIKSYASRENNPTFYWPFVVFLDDKACVLEGAGGYKNQESESNVIQHMNIEGMIQVPKNSHYILMTPLASAIDVDQHGLSNQGQLKLSVIR